MKWLFNAVDMFKNQPLTDTTGVSFYDYSVAVANLNTNTIMINLKMINTEYNSYTEKELIQQISIIMSHEVMHQEIKRQTGLNKHSCMWDNIAYGLEEYL